MPPAPGSVACPALTIYTMRIQALTSTLLSLVVLIQLAGPAQANADTANQARSTSADIEDFERNREMIEQEWKEEERRIKAGEELPTDMERDAASASDARREVGQNQRLSRYFFPWGIVASFALCAFLYWRPKLLPPFFYRELWLTVTLIGMAILWWPVIFMVNATDAADEFLIPKMIGDSVQLLLVIALGYGLFLLARKHIKPVV
jgi:hypothetical protein